MEGEARVFCFQSQEPQDAAAAAAASAPLASRTSPTVLLQTWAVPPETRPSETRPLPSETRTSLGDRGACGGTPLGGAVVTSSSWADDAESESWEATVPPVSTAANATATASCTHYH